MPKKKLPASSKKSASIKKRVETNTHSLRNKIAGLFFVTIALLIILVPNYLPKKQLETKNPIKISSELLTSKLKENLPARIVIPKSNIDISVTPSKIVNGYWELSESTASYGEGSGVPGQNGNAVIFAHAREGLFYNLKDVKTGDTIYVFTKNNWYRYRVTNITAVYPNQTEVIKPTKDQTLTLYTCTGFSDEKRLIVTAKPEK